MVECGVLLSANSIPESESCRASFIEEETEASTIQLLMIIHCNGSNDKMINLLTCVPPI